MMEVEPSEPSCVSWPKWATAWDGACMELATSALRTGAKGSSSWPTPQASLGPKGGLVTNQKGCEGKNLIQAVANRMFPTPTAVTDTVGAAMCKWGGSGSRAKLKGMVTPEELNGALNPDWVTALMGFPPGWLDVPSVGKTARGKKASRE